MSGTVATQTISTTIHSSIQVGSGYYAGTLIITDSGAVDVASTPASQYAVFAPNGTIINYGLIFNSGAYGVQERTNGRYTTGLEKNFGSIIAGNTGLLMSGSLYNSGHINGTMVCGVSAEFATITNIGEIYGGEFGVDLLRGTNAMSNSGSIGGGTIGTSLYNGSIGNSGTIDGGVTGVRLNKAIISNTGHIYGGSEGLYVHSGGPINNSGSIGGGADGVYFRTSAGLTNTGQINGGKIGVYERSGSLKLTNAGTISGGIDAIDFVSGSFDLTIDPGAAFNGTVIDRAGKGRIVLGAGSQPGSLNMNNTFVGFTGITIASGATWSVMGSTVELTAGEKIAGFQQQDTMTVEGFVATAKHFVYGTGLVLSNATASETLALNAKYLNEFFNLYSGGGNTTIVAKQDINPPESIVSKLTTSQVNPGAGDFSENLTITATGTVSYATGPALLNGKYAVPGSILNQGLIITHADTFAVYLEADTLMNSGTITGASGADLDGGEITNAGSVSGTAGIGVELNGASLVNQRSISGQIGVDSTNGYINNSGSISGKTGNGVELENTTLSNSGQVSGSTDGVYIKGDGAVFNSGAISGGSKAIQSTGLLDLTINPHATFKGAVTTESGSLLTLEGTTAGHLDISSFTGFSTIDFGAGSIWSLEGDLAQLAKKQAILGFAFGDTIVLDSFVTTGTVYANDELILQAGSKLETLHIAGSFSSSSFIITENGGATDISLVKPASPVHAAIVTISEPQEMRFMSPGAWLATAATAETAPLNGFAAGVYAAAQWHSLPAFNSTSEPFGHASFASWQSPAGSVNPINTAALSVDVLSGPTATHPHI